MRIGRAPSAAEDPKPMNEQLSRTRPSNLLKYDLAALLLENLLHVLQQGHRLAFRGCNGQFSIPAQFKSNGIDECTVHCIVVYVLCHAVLGRRLPDVLKNHGCRWGLRCRGKCGNR